MSSKGHSRRAFLQRSGSIAVAFTFMPDLLGELSGVAADGAAPLLRVVPPPPAVPYADTVSWIILEPGKVAIHSGRVELGTGVQTAMTQIALEELHLDNVNVTYVQGDTRRTADEGTTAGSKSVQNGGPLLRRAAATAFQELLARAAAELGVPASQLTASDGKFSVIGSNKQVTYEKLLRKKSTILTALGATVPVANPDDYTLVGQSLMRQDLPGKVFATFEFVQDVRVPDMLHGRVIRPAGRNDTFAGFDAASLASAAAIPGFVQIVQIGNFVGVLAETEFAAIKAATPRLGGVRVNWNSGPALLPQASLYQALKDPVNVYGTNLEVRFGEMLPITNPRPDVAETNAAYDATFAAAEVQVNAEYTTPFQMHASFGPSCAVADVRGAPDPTTGVQATVWSQTQGVYPLRRALSGLLGYASETAVHVIYEEGAGCYGHDGADDVAADAALMSQAVGRAVRVQWSRQDEHGWEPLGAGMVHVMQGGVSGQSVVAWDHAVYSPPHNSRPNGTNGGSLIAGMLVGMMPATLGSAAGTNSTTRNAPLNYTFSNRLTHHAVRSFVTQTNGGANATTDRAPAAPLTWKLPRSTALRSLGGYSNTFANESFLGELAATAGLDDLQVRLDHLSDPRALAVVEALLPAWAARPMDVDGTGAGIAFARYETIEAYVAAYVEVTVDRTTGVIRVQHAVVAHDCGLIINPDGLRNQVEGQVMQAASRCLKEEVQFNAKGVTSVQWERNPLFGVVAQQYPVISFNEAPSVEVILIDRPHAPAWGAGEPSIGVIGGAIGNAVFHAVGVRLRSLPMVPAKVLAALSAV